ncbi:hypothetical protein L226DRAFT_563909 [Lentinus tigrinus ALCF2SS1-7]|uniref:uncharacterized protein n=1 Tax=Lentinus tigrinus ALCF2SS1-7 TaxID=1328758 RepID=UPI001165D4DF|nr:hypothetical protein L226DRAFT_563909 [Lentinus tigrinus ALCF2SS1-7]
MPTATTTTTAPSVISLKAMSSPQSSSLSSAAATLRSLYPRAARAFLQRDVSLTHSLLTSAFSLIHPPASLATLNDALASQRRKWEILRITFETTLYASPPSQAPETLPPALRANLMLTPEPLMTTLHSRSLHLFTPVDSPQKATSAFLPGQILVTLVLASLKLDCPEVGRGMIEDWLARHGQETDAGDPTVYAKVLELYCLHVLPRLQDWEYAEDFLTYERQLSPDMRQHFIASLRQLRSEALAASRVQAALSNPPGTSSPSRSPSPAMSDSSASSSSTHTATPHRPQANGRIPTLTPLTPSHSQSPTPKPREPHPHSASSSSIASTATSRTVTPQNDRAHTKRRANANGNGNGHATPHAKGESRSRSSTPAAGPSSSVLRRSSFGAPATESSTRPPSTFALIRASLSTLLQNTSRSRVLLYAILFVVVPVVSFVLRVRRRRVTAAGAKGALSGNADAGAGAVDAVRRRLRGVSTEGQGSAVGRLWEEVARAVVDTVRMAGRGLV